MGVGSLSRNSQLTASDIVTLFERDQAALKSPAELLVTVPDIRLAILQGILREVTTKRDLEQLRRELMDYIDRRITELRTEFRTELERRVGEVRGEVQELRAEVRNLSKGVTRLEGTVSLLVKVFVSFNVAVLVGIIGILIKLVLG